MLADRITYLPERLGDPQGGGRRARMAKDRFHGAEVVQIDHPPRERADA